MDHNPHNRDPPRPVSILCLLDRGPGLSLEADILPSNPLLLAPYSLDYRPTPSACAAASTCTQT